MTRDDIIRMAREVGAGEPESLYGRTDYVVMTKHELERFAALVAAADPDCEYHKQRAALWRHEAYRLGGTPLPWDADVAIAKAVAAEREACARAASIALLGSDKSLSDRVLNAIRARGEAPAQIGEQFMHVTDGIYEENGEIKSGTIPDHIVQADQARSAPATRAYYAKAIERANQFTESLRQERLKREAGESGDE